VLSSTMALLLTQAGPSGEVLYHGDHRGRCGLVGSSAKVTHPPFKPGITVSPRSGPIFPQRLGAGDHGGN
jgi:hypothetical protein